MTSPIRVLRQIVAPNGRHRPRRAAPLPDQPVTQTATVGGVLDEAEMEQLLEAGDAVANESAPCPAEQRTTFHAMHRDGSRTCWTCGTVTLPGGVS